MTTKTAALRSHHARQSLAARFKWLRHWRLVLDVTGAVIVGTAVLSVAAQFLYPADRALPFMQVGGVDVGFKNRASIERQLTEYAQAGEVTVVTPSAERRAKWQSVGISIDSATTTSVVTTYDTWERAIPFSAIARVLDSRTMPMLALADPERLDAFAEQIVKDDKRAAKDATILVKDGQVHINSAKNGYKFTADEVKRQIQGTAVSVHSRLELRPQDVPFVRSEEALQQAASEAEAALSHQLTIKIADKQYAPGRGAVGNWLSFADDEKTKGVALVIDREAIKKYLETINKDFAIDPGTSTITLLDGQEIARTPAPQGRSVAVDSSIDKISQALLAKDTTPAVQLAIADVPPRLNYIRTYSQSSAGLQAIINDWDRDHYGDFAVLVRELGGERRYADIQPDKPFVTASTFKIFVYYGIQQRIQAGQLQYGDRTDIGWTVESCLEEMIVRSTNPCAVSFQNLLGWQASQDYVAAAGFPNTFIDNRTFARGPYPGEKTSTVRDETNYMLRLQAGTLMGQEATDRLMGYLKRQIWRAGIPSGVPRGVTVADKVGFYNGWRHDIAIVYAPKGTYILGVMSRGGADSHFADLSRRVYNFFNN